MSDEYRKYMGYENPDETVTLPMDIQFIEDREFRNLSKARIVSGRIYRPECEMIAVAEAKIRWYEKRPERAG